MCDCLCCACVHHVFGVSYMIIGFHDDNVRRIFGIVKKRKYCPLSDFSFTCMCMHESHVQAANAYSTSYIFIYYVLQVHTHL